MKKNISIYVIIVIIIALMGGFIYILLTNKSKNNNNDKTTTTTKKTITQRDPIYYTNDLGVFEKGNSNAVVEVDIKLPTDILNTEFKNYKVNKDGFDCSFTCLSYSNTCNKYDVSINNGNSILVYDNTSKDKKENKLFIYSGYAALISKDIKSELIEISLFIKNNNYNQMFYQHELLSSMKHDNKNIGVYPVFNNNSMYYVSIEDNKYRLNAFNLSNQDEQNFNIKVLKTYPKTK